MNKNAEKRMEQHLNCVHWVIHKLDRKITRLNSSH